MTQIGPAAGAPVGRGGALRGSGVAPAFPLPGWRQVGLGWGESTNP